MELSPAELTLVLEALEDGAFFRDARSRVLDSAARRSNRKFPSRSVQEGAGADADRKKAKDYTALAERLRGPREKRTDGPTTD